MRLAQGMLQNIHQGAESADLSPRPFCWLDEIVSGSATNVEQIATRQKCSVRQVNMTISLAFLAPDLVRAAVEGRLPTASVSSDSATLPRNGAASSKPSD
jgi:hypothetical protein